MLNAPGSGTPGFTTYTGSNPQQSSLPAPPEGGSAVYNGHNGPGSYVLYQDITLPAGQAQTLSLTAFYQNQFTQGFITPATLDYRTGPNQQFRIDIVSPTGDPLATTSDVVKLNVFRTAVGDPLARGAFTVTVDLGAFAGQTVRLRVAVTNSQLFLFGGVDNVHFAPTVPPTPGAVQGVKFNDLDGDGVRDLNEPGLQGWTIYADTNLNGWPDAGEPSTVTGPDGAYPLALLPGTYRIRELNQGG
ncbi:hypothetical protein [Limnoglobus roseus]|uniref:PKD domain-containing protein n=1 Tax=Limnoglobus roseus TaxID=2598579 RepID=A0A5C1A8Y1_9BACT|nr:hypothetical protein [Limnoglobus roseus]QEL14663.1 PKD domain-containing protein [Limnoglobus roseus]